VAVVNNRVTGDQTILADPVALNVKLLVPLGAQYVVLEAVIIIAANGFTVIVLLETPTHPFAFVKVYKMEVVPADTPDTTPFTTVATKGLALLHIPPTVAFVHTIVAFTHTPVGVPAMAATAGSGFTVKLNDTKFAHPFPSAKVYLTDAVPATKPNTTPVELFTDTKVGVVVDHVPPAVLLDNVVVPFIQTLDNPVIAGKIGNGFTVNVAVDEVSAAQGDTPDTIT